MYATFEKTIGRNRTSYDSGKQVQLFGCNEGWIPWFVKLGMPSGQSEPYAWHVRIEDAVALPDVGAERPKASAILIDIKPGSKDSFLIFELLDVYGYSADEWTPMLWRMRVLANAGPKDNHLEDFDASNDGAIIYNFVYAMGGVIDGHT